VQGQDKVYKDVIEPLESVSINMIPTIKEDIRDLGPPDQVCSIIFVHCQYKLNWTCSVSMVVINMFTSDLLCVL
jgi:hypothetical protein